MSGLLSGLASLGLDNLENLNIFEKKGDASADGQAAKALEEKPNEEEFIYDKQVECPVCGEKVIAKVVKSGKAKLIATDIDLRPKYDAFDSIKYDVIACEECGFAALPRYFGMLAPSQVKAIKENISKNVTVSRVRGPIYTYEQSLERYRLALANAVVKKAKNSEKAYICLKTAWLLRGYVESGELDANPDKKDQMKAMEEEFMQNAYTGFKEARQTENFPMCGMDESTIDYLLGAIAYEVKDYDVAARMVQSLMTSKTATKRAKDKAYLLKEKILEAKKSAQ